MIVDGLMPLIYLHLIPSTWRCVHESANPALTTRHPIFL